LASFPLYRQKPRKAGRNQGAKVISFHHLLTSKVEDTQRTNFCFFLDRRGEDLYKRIFLDAFSLGFSAFSQGLYAFFSRRVYSQTFCIPSASQYLIRNVDKPLLTSSS